MANTYAYCPLRTGINCDQYGKKKCDRCGWHPREDNRRKQLIRERIQEGSWHGKLTV